MSSTPQIDLWLERSRLAGMILAAVSYGGFFVLTIQATSALMQRPRSEGQIARNRRWLLFYVIITFALCTIGVAANSKYTEMIWIDLRDAPGGPITLIQNELDYSINVMTVVCYHVMEWFMQALLLHRCFVIWSWSRYVVISMTALLVAMIAMSILVLIQASTGNTWYNIDTVPIYYAIQVAINVIYTILVTKRLFVMRREIRRITGEYASVYDTVILMIIESTMLYTPLAILFTIAFAVHSNISNLWFLGISHVQGIAQLLIIVRVARGRSIAGHATTPSSVSFSGTRLDPAERTNLEPIARTKQDGIQLLSVRTQVV